MKKLKQICMTVFIGLIASTGMIGLSASTASPALAAGGCAGESPVFPRWYDGLCDGDKIKSPGSDIKGFMTKVALNIVTIILTVVGYVSLGFIIWGGFKYMISGDNASGISGAKTTILNAVIGLVLSIMAVAIVKLVTGAIR